MITRKTVFVLGAGASKPYGYPTGEELIRRVIDLREDQRFRKFVSEAFALPAGSRHEKAENIFRGMAYELAGSGLLSIDSYFARIENKPAASRDQQLSLGRFAVAYILLDIQNGNINNLPVSNPQTSNGDWYRYLYNKFLFDPKDNFEKFLENRISFITFNYDVSLEIFFYNAIANAFKEKANFEKVIERIPMLHVYGRMTSLPWEFSGLERVHRSVGGATTSDRVAIASGGIKFIHDSERVELTIQDQIKKAFDGASKVIFMGFGFGLDNFNQLEFELDDKTPSYATVLGSTQSERTKLLNDLRAFDSAGYPRLNLFDLDCLSWLRNFAHDLN